VGSVGGGLALALVSATAFGLSGSFVKVLLIADWCGHPFRSCRPE